ncbi:MAG: dephospho-CoA kinase [Candidatus Kapaibacterium sp.]
MKEKRTLVIGITGGIGSGKTMAADLIAEKGYPVIKTDIIAAILMNTDNNIQNRLKQEFGDNIIKNGKPDRTMMAEMVFGTDEKSRRNLNKLNALIHPAVIDSMSQQIEIYEETATDMVIVESALIFDTGLYEGFDYVITVEAKKELRIKRLKESRGLTERDVELRMANQLSSEERMRLADFVIENNGTPEDLEKSVNFILGIVSSLPPKDFSKSDDEENY